MKIAHIRNWKELAKFFIAPFPPNRMVVLYTSQDSGECYYDREIEIIDKDTVTFKNESTIITAKISKSDFLDSFTTASMFNAMGPKDKYTPFSLAWRWIVFFSIIVYILFAWLVLTIYPEPVPMKIGGVVYKVMPQHYQPPLWKTVVASSLFLGSIVYYISTILRFQDPVIKYAAFILQKDEGLPRLEPIPVLSNYFPLQKLEKFKDSASDYSAKFSALVVERDLLKHQAVEFAKVARNIRKFNLLQLRLESSQLENIHRWALAWIAFLVLGIVIGLGFGWFLGSHFSVSTHAGVNKTAEGASGVQILQQPVQQPQINITQELEKYPVKPVEPLTIERNLTIQPR